MVAWTKQKALAFESSFYDFLSHCVINSKEKGQIHLGRNTYLAQKMFTNAIFTGLQSDIHDFKCLKSRQLGMSTIARAFGLFWLGVHDGLQGACVLDTDSNRQYARIEIETMIKNLPRRLKFPAVKASNRHSLILENDSKLLFMSAGTRSGASSGQLGRSTGLNFCIASEMCSWQNQGGIVSFKEALSESFENRLYIWESPLALSTLLPTPKGWTTMGEVREGDTLFDDNGQRCRVIGVSPIFSKRECFEIVFSNGDKIVSDGSHKWQVEERRWPTNPQWKTKIVPTSDLSVDNHRVQVSKPLEMKDAELPIDPYFLGVWLGAGRSDQPAITCGDDDIEELWGHLKARGCPVGPIRKYDWRVGKFTVLGQRPIFSSLGLLGNKHIPPIYLRASESQRRELLAGLMDTDGHVDANLRAEYCSISPRLVDDVAELLSSLGIKFTRSQLSSEGKVRAFPHGKKSYACRASERLRFSEAPNLKVFNLNRKRDVHRSDKRERGYTWRKAKFLKIVSIRKIDPVPVKCISVDSPSHLFLAGRTMIPTHNTARGFNSWWDMWKEARDDKMNQITTFLGWYTKDSQRISCDDRAYAHYMSTPPSETEKRKMQEVYERYGIQIDDEQLAWYRRKIDPSRSSDEDDPIDSYKQSEQPWTEDDAFVTTGSTFFDTQRLTSDMHAMSGVRYKAYKYVPGSEFVGTDFVPAFFNRDIDLKVWEEPEEDAQYVVAADPAFGHDENNDRSCAQVLKCYADKVEQVAEFASPSVPAHQFAWLCASLCGWYKYCYFILEINGPGEAVWQEYRSLPRILQGYNKKAAEERGLRNIFTNVRNYIYQRADSLGAGSVLQFKTQSQTKVAIMERLRDFHSNGTLLIRSAAALEEMRTVTRSGDQIRAEGSTNKDDRAISLALGCRAWEEKLRNGLISQNRTKGAEIARRQLSGVGRYEIFTRNQLDAFFKKKRAEKTAEIRAMQRAMQRNAGRRSHMFRGR